MVAQDILSRLPNEVPVSFDFPAEEERVYQYWKDSNAFLESVALSEGKPTFSFYDGPPFATGLPHYGHLLAGTIKDIVCRFAHQRGHHVPRRFGWDTHGVPIEFEIEKKLGIKTKEQVFEYGIGPYNDQCRGIVQRYAKEWKEIVGRAGRWIDFDNDYKTMDKTFMDSLWWVFKTLYDKGLVYHGFRVMPYSNGCATPLSNHEAKENYHDKNDPAITVSFPVLDADEPVSFLAWTTTPWTLPSNLALCVNPELTYVYLHDVKKDQTFIMAEKCINGYYKKVKKGKQPEDHKILKKVEGSDLVGMRYEPLFPYFFETYKERAFKVLSDSYVTEESGTGVVHQAPAFGEDDYRVCLATNVIDKGEGIPCPLDANGIFIDPVSDFKGQYIKDADENIMATLKEKGRLFKKTSINHRVGFCWRSDTQLISRAVPSWFIAVEKIKDKIIANNAKTSWVPASMKDKRFGEWLKNARDWNVSRNRFWGTPIPIWLNEETKEIIVVGSAKELEELSGVAGITDLHSHKIDHITITSKKTGAVLRRTSEVFDCWFESGSMPYAQVGYPHVEGSKELFEKSFPADFIAEGLDQTRGWFYTLMILSTALFDKPAFKNVVVNGMVLAEDGKKMSKRLKNYPDPQAVTDEHGSDALRLYLIDSPCVRAEPLRFRKDGVKNVVKEVMLPWYNSLRFMVQNARSLGINSGKPVLVEDNAMYAKYRNQMDRWIESTLSSLIKEFNEEMDGYRLYTIVPKLLNFIKALTDWYVRLNRPRLKGVVGSEEEQRAALGTLSHVLLSLSILMAPFAPFFAEYSYKILRPMAPEHLQKDSVHFLMLPESDDSAVDTSFEEAVYHMQEAVKLGRVARDQREIALKQPLQDATIIHHDHKVLDNIKSLENYVKSELNVRNVIYSTEESKYVDLKADADGKVLGKKLGKNFKKVHGAVRALTAERVAKFERDGELEIEDITVKLSECNISRELRKDVVNDANISVKSAPFGLLVALNTVLTPELEEEGSARELVNRVQKLRKACGLVPVEKVETFVDTDAEPILRVLESKKTFMAKLLNAPSPLCSSEMPKHCRMVEIPDEEGAAVLTSSGAAVGEANSSTVPEPAVVMKSSEKPSAHGIGDPREEKAVKCTQEVSIDGNKLRLTMVRCAPRVSVERVAEQVDGNEKVAENVASLVATRTLKSLGFVEGVKSKELKILSDGVTHNVVLNLDDNVFANTAARLAAGAPR